MKRRHLPFLLLLLVSGAYAQGYWRDVPPEDRREMRQQMREYWRQEREIRRDDGTPRWREMPVEDRQRLRDEIRDTRGWGDQPGNRGAGGRGGRGN